MHRMISAAMDLLDAEVRRAVALMHDAKAKGHNTKATKMCRRAMGYGLRATRLAEWTVERYGRPATTPACIVYFPKP